MDFKKIIEAHEQAVAALKESCLSELEKMAEICRQAIKNDHKILLCGNGGSAADS